ncbi:MAG TPA: DUF3710 domain-containing protein [Dermatophilaceae bacterium]|nr:DUF3710 domain-containing protein [Dermatophilaceae bacterium]
MGIFSRRKRDDLDQAEPVAVPVGAAVRGDPGAPASPRDSGDQGAVTHAAYERPDGPFDRSEVSDPGNRLDLGSLWVAGAPGMEMRLEVDNQTQQVVGVTTVIGESALQLQAFAAPRSDGVWGEIRQEIAAGITSQGGTAQEADGPLGVELHAQLPGRAPDGRTYFTPARFVGVDGPRWFLRGVLSGRAAVEEDAAAALLQVYRGTVVVRGDEAMAPRDLLPLRLPEDAVQAAPDPADQLNPFERGPEITEVR